MKRYVDKATGNIWTIHQIRAKYKDTMSIPDDWDCNDLGFAFLIDTPKPPAQPWCHVVEGLPDAAYQQTWVQAPVNAAEIKRALTIKAENILESEARSKGYGKEDGTGSAVDACMKYASFTNPWQAQAIAFGNWMTSVWLYMFQMEVDINAGQRTPPTEDELAAEISANLPMVWP